MLSGQISVILADGVGGGDGVIRQLVVVRDGLYQLGRRLPVRQLLAQKRVEHRS